MQQSKKFYLLPFFPANLLGSKLHRQAPQYQGKHSTLIWGAVYFLCSGLLSCGSLPQSGMNAINFGVGVDVTNIRDLQPRNDKSTVYLQGKVTKQVPLLEHRVYQLQDSTGTIWVLTKQTGLQPQDKLLIKGNIRYQSIPLAGKDFGEVYVEEQQRLERTPAS